MTGGGRAKRRRAELNAAPFDCEVTDLASDGRGVARVDGKVVFVADALPGETVRARRVRQRRGNDDAQLVSVLRASADRRTPECPHYGVCGGCALQHLASDAQLRFKQKQLADAFTRIGRVAPATWASPLTGPTLGYRRRARLGVKYVPPKGGTLVGFRERSTPFLAVIDQCAVLDARVGTQLPLIARAIDRLSIRARLPQIEVAAGDRVALVLRVLDQPTPADEAVLRGLAVSGGFDIWLQPGTPDTAFPLDATPLPRFTPDGAHWLTMQPTDFIQINDRMGRDMVGRALEWLAPTNDAELIELFAGLGHFTVPLAASGARVTAVEGEPGLVARGRDNTLAAGQDVDWQVADLMQAPLAAKANDWPARRFDLALLDPPRAGAHAMLPWLAASGAQRVLYVSCHPATLARDAGILVHQFGFRLERACVMDMFPHTAHVESMALLTR